MKWTILIVICIFSVNIAKAQKQLFMTTNDSQCPVNIASAEIKDAFTPPPAKSKRVKSASNATSQIVVTFIDFPEDAKKAFLYAASIWEDLLTSPVPINIMATWESLPGDIIAKSRPTLNFRTFEGAAVPDVYYPVALVEKLTATEMNRGEPDIVCSFNKNMSWYFETNGNTPNTKYDFVTAVLHEITHGLGFYGFFKDNNESGYFNNANNLPSIFDYFIFNEMNQQISNKIIFNSPSVELHQQLTSDKLKLYEPEVFTDNQETFDWIYAPNNWEEGASIYHLKNSETSSKLMAAFLRKGEAIHHPGEKTTKILSEIGWESITFNFEPVKDQENSQCNVPISIGINADLPIDSSSFRMYFSTDQFITSEYIELTYNQQINRFSGELPINNFQGVIQYYFQIITKENRAVQFPSTAPVKKFSFRVGPDYYPPEILHNPEKIISAQNKKLNISAIANDNIGVGKVKLEYKINGTLKEAIVLENDSANVFITELEINEPLIPTDRLEYRLVAEDISLLKNKKNEPAVGFHTVKIFKPSEPIYSYSNDFNSYVYDFLLSDFSASRPAGFYNGNLHTTNPYQSSKIENEYYNHIALLKHPVILRENGYLEFDEIVLVEPGEYGSSYNGYYFWDYVIVEGSKDNGNSWQPISNGYDAQIEDSWHASFEETIINNSSTAPGIGNMFVKHAINLTANQNFSAGDTVLIRFRLAADNTVNGWGWAIDNLEIQRTVTATNEIDFEKIVSVYPNPFNNVLTIESQNMENRNETTIVITSILGKTVFYKNGENLYTNKSIQIDLSALKKGIYFLNIIKNNSIITTKKLIKN